METKHTPETDAVCAMYFYDGGPDIDAPDFAACPEADAAKIAAHARTLERDRDRLKAINAELVGALQDAIYAITELGADGYLDFEPENECTINKSESFCSRHCESCGCIELKIKSARAALTKAGA